MKWVMKMDYSWVDWDTRIIMMMVSVILVTVFFAADRVAHDNDNDKVLVLVMGMAMIMYYKL